MSVKKVFEELIEAQQKILSRELKCMNSSAPMEDLKTIEKMIQDELPESFKELYVTYNGENGNNGKLSIFLGEKFLSTKEIIDNLKFSLSLVKPKDRVVDNPEESKRLTDEIVQLVKKFAVPETKTLDIFPKKAKWHKLEFECSTNSFSGVYVYKEDNENREIAEVDCLEHILKLVKSLHEIERVNYNWDEVEFIVFENGKYQVNRKDYNFSEEISFESIPEGKIKKVYFNPRWIPIFSDYSGNFIGIDLDPDCNGIKGQVINFGRDEEKMYVYANELEQFFEKVLDLLKTEEFKNVIEKYHLHDALSKALYK